MTLMHFPHLGENLNNKSR